MALQLGSFMDSAVKGFSAGLDLQDAVNQKKMRIESAKAIGIAKAKIDAHNNEFKIDATVPTEANSNGVIKTRDLSNSVLPGDMPDAPNQVATRSIAVPQQQVAQVDTTPQAPVVLDNTPINNPLSDATNQGTPIVKLSGGGSVNEAVNANSLGLDSASIMNAGQAQPVQPTEPLQPTQQQAPAQAPVQQAAAPQQTQGLDSTQAQQAPAPTPQQRKAYYSRAAIDKELYDKLTDSAVKYGDPKAALQYFKASFDTSQNMIKDNLANAQREFEQFGDLSSFKDLYNHAYPDGRQVSDIQKDDKGNYVITSQGTDSKPLTQTYSVDQVKSMLMHFDDTEGLWKAQAATAAERQKLNEASTRKIDEDNNKLQTISAGQALVNPKTGKAIYTNTKSDKPAKYVSAEVNGKVMMVNENDPSDMKEIGASNKVQMNDADNLAVGKGKGKGNDTNAWDDTEIKTLNKSILDNNPRFTTNSDATGERVPSSLGNQALVIGQRLRQSQPQLSPADLGRLASLAITDPKALTTNTYRMKDGSTRTEQVIIDRGVTYKIGGAKDTATPAATKTEAKLIESKPMDKAGLDSLPVKKSIPTEQPMTEPTQPTSGNNVSRPLQEKPADVKQLQSELRKLKVVELMTEQTQAESLLKSSMGNKEVLNTRIAEIKRMIDIKRSQASVKGL
jgi:hypothetical protein